MNLNVPKTDSNGQDKSHQKFESMPKPTAVTAASSNSDQNTTLQHPKDKQQEQQVNKSSHSNEDTNFIKDNNKTQQQDPQQNGQQYINQDEQTQQNHSDQNRERGNENEEQQDDYGDASESNKRIILQRFTIYNATTTMYIVGSNSKESLFRIMEISKDEENDNVVSIIEDSNYFYTRKDMIELLNGLDESIEGGIHKVAQGYGMLGLIRFTQSYYLCLITKCSQVAILGGHFIYHIDETKLIPLGTNYKRPEKYSDEERLLSIFKYMDLGKTFYFSYSYDITNTLQTNFVRNKKKATDLQFGVNTNKVNDLFNNFEHNERFVWNNLLLKLILDNPEVATYEWFQPIIHGFIDQANISVYGRKFYITIIARRSHHFAGARFLKRGVNDKGNVANEIETEQIVSDMLITSFHDPKYGFYNNPRYTSFVQHRGSIPLYWTQDMNKLPKPPIQINLNDPFYQSSALHFNDLFHRYGSPIIVLNLIKQKEKQPRESKLNHYFMACIKYLDQFLPEGKKIQYFSFDMSRHSKKNLDVIGPIQAIAANAMSQIGFFHNGINLSTTKLQKGIIRTNCIDCLDRTNAAQFIICKEALTHQLRSLKIISETQNLDYDSDLINVVTEIFHDHGDTIAIQYGGSNLVNTMDSYRRINQWSSHTRDMLNSIKRMYSNSFMDSIRQEAINLFLGNYIYEPDKPKLWELQNDYALHNDYSGNGLHGPHKSYINWYNEAFLLDSRYSFPGNECNEVLRLEAFPDCNEKWFNECYIPRKYQSFTELFQFNMNSNSRYFPPTENTENGNKFDYSPFESRRKKYKTFEHESKAKPEIKTPRSKRIQKFLPFKNGHNNTSSLISSKRNLDLIEDNDEEDRSITPDPDQANSIVTVNEKDIELYNSQWDYDKIIKHQTINTQDYSFNPRVKTNIEDKEIYWYYSNEIFSKLRNGSDGAGAARREDLISPQDLKTYLTFDSIDNEMITNFNNQLDLNTDNNYFF
ncbi:SAC domain-containing protein [Candida albicans]